MSRGAVCLGVTRSSAGRAWRYRLDDDSRATGIAQRLGIPEPLARILAGRSVPEADLDRHFDTSLKAWMPDPSALLDLDRAAERLADALIAGEPCAVFGDYDVDGGTSSALMSRYFRALGRPLRVYIPDRMTEGYGPNPAAMRQLAEEGIRLLVTVDCGAQAFDALAVAEQAGLQVIVSDHHQMTAGSPAAYAVVNPNQPGDTSGLGHVCAAGVTFMLLAGVNRDLRRRNWFAKAGVAEPDLRRYLDLVALATVCDVVPLVGLNRAFVKHGLRILDAGENAGLAALKQIAGLKGALRSSHFGFALGPRVNAGGRVGRAELGALMLASDDVAFAGEAASELDRYNRERQSIEAFVLEAALEQVEKTGTRPGLVAASGEGWHAGVVGIVAGRLKDKYDLPSAVFAIEGDIARASLRSVSGVDLGAAVGAAKAEGLLVSGGGHAMAAGLSVERARLEDVIAFLDERLAPAVESRTGRGLYAIDAVVGPAGLTPAFYDMVERAGPYGAGNPEPVIAVPDARIVDARIVGENHVSVVAMCGGDRLKAIAFRAADTPVGAALMQKGRPIHLAGRLLANDWQGQRRIELSIEDAAAV
ncbi:Single-stranded-DNA-specific exonuclease RecJ [Alphaproteobacteria bacterium SO-S41]|nr:Single-stranded-DNA-specific exonuclease RecJ [Alphaproteobacteria bacterium SO-S41]